MAKILVVDDGNTSLAYICTALNNEGHDLIPFKDGSDALNYLEDADNELPDIIISDVIMPNMDGYTLLTTLQQEKRTQNIPFIIMTTKNALQSTFEPSSNVIAFLEKPVNLTQLSDTVKKILKKNQ